MTIRPSFWLLGMSSFVFVSLAMLKRVSELRAMAGKSQIAGRGYRSEDMPVVLALGVSSGMIAVLIMAMYTQADVVAELYPAREWLWLASPLMLYWMARLHFPSARRRRS